MGHEPTNRRLIAKNGAYTPRQRGKPLVGLADSSGSGDDPGYQVFLRSEANLSDKLALDLDLRAIDE